MKYLLSFFNTTLRLLSDNNLLEDLVYRKLTNWNIRKTVIASLKVGIPFLYLSSRDLKLKLCNNFFIIEFLLNIDNYLLIMLTVFKLWIEIFSLFGAAHFFEVFRYHCRGLLHLLPSFNNTHSNILIPCTSLYKIFVVACCCFYNPH